MTDRVPYSFVILRYVHDSLAGEFLNVGIVMHVPTQRRLLVRTQKRIGRLRQAFPDLDLHVFRDLMMTIDRGVAVISQELAHSPLLDRDTDALACAQRVLPHDDSSLQWSTIGWGSGTDPDQKLDCLFDRCVARYDKRPQGRPRRSDDDILRAFRTRLSDRGVDVPFEAKTVRGRQDEITFPTAWRNGRWHAFEPVSLDMTDEKRIKNKARRWRGHLSAVREGASDDVSLHLLVGRPSEDSLSAAYEIAKAILEGSAFGPQVVEEDDMEGLVERAQTEYFASIR